MVPNLISAPHFFGPLEIWTPRSLNLEKYYPQEIWFQYENHQIAFSCGSKLLGAQKSQGPNFLGTKFFREQISWGPKKSGAKMRSGTISVTAKKKGLTPLCIYAAFRRSRAHLTFMMKMHVP